MIERMDPAGATTHAMIPRNGMSDTIAPLSAMANPVVAMLFDR
jgi:hypothetical protein